MSQSPIILLKQGLKNLQPCPNYFDQESPLQIMSFDWDFRALIWFLLISNVISVKVTIIMFNYFAFPDNRFKSSEEVKELMDKESWSELLRRDIAKVDLEAALNVCM